MLLQFSWIFVSLGFANAVCSYCDVCTDDLEGCLSKAVRCLSDFHGRRGETIWVIAQKHHSKTITCKHMDVERFGCGLKAVMFCVACTKTYHLGK